MRKYYFRHCGSLHPVSKDYIYRDNGEVLDYIPIIGCPICAKLLWLSHVFYVDTVSEVKCKTCGAFHNVEGDPTDMVCDYCGDFAQDLDKVEAKA